MTPEGSQGDMDERCTQDVKTPSRNKSKRATHFQQHQKQQSSQLLSEGVETRRPFGMREWVWSGHPQAAHQSSCNLHTAITSMTVLFP